MYDASFTQISDLTVPSLLQTHHHQLRSEQQLRWLMQQRVLQDIAADLVHCTPSPQLGDTIVISLGSSDSVKICRHYSRGFPVYDDNIAPLFLLLSASSILSLLQALLLEGKVILHSLHPAVISNVAHTLRRLLFPWKFAGSFIPLLPSSMLLAVQVPGCFIIGIETVAIYDLSHRQKFLRDAPIPQDALIVDLDTGRLLHKQEFEPFPSLPDCTIRQILKNRCPHACSINNSVHSVLSARTLQSER